MFANGPGDLGSIPGRVIPKTQKMVLDASLLNTQHYKVRIKGKVEQSREGVEPSPTHWCSSYRKGSLRVTLDYGRQLYLLYIYIYIYILSLKRQFFTIYIYILSSTDRSVSFYQNTSVWLDRLDSRSWDRNPVDSNANPRFYYSTTRKPAQAKEI